MTTTALDDLKAWLQIPQNVESSSYPMLPACLAVAQRCVRACTGLDQTALVTEDTAETTRTFDGRGPSRNVDSFVGTPSLVEHSWDHATWTEVPEWWAEPSNATVQYRIHSIWPIYRWVRVTAKFGIDDTTADILRLATVMKAAKLWQRRNSINGIEGESSFGIVRITRAEDPDIHEILEHAGLMHYRYGIA